MSENNSQIDPGEYGRNASVFTNIYIDNDTSDDEIYEFIGLASSTDSNIIKQSIQEPNLNSLKYISYDNLAERAIETNDYELFKSILTLITETRAVESIVRNNRANFITPITMYRLVINLETLNYLFLEFDNEATEALAKYMDFGPDLDQVMVRGNLPIEIDNDVLLARNQKYRVLSETSFAAYLSYIEAIRNFDLSVISQSQYEAVWAAAFKRYSGEALDILLQMSRIGSATAQIPDLEIFARNLNIIDKDWVLSQSNDLRKMLIVLKSGFRFIGNYAPWVYKIMIEEDLRTRYNHKLLTDAPIEYYVAAQLAGVEMDFVDNLGTMIAAFMITGMGVNSKVYEDIKRQAIKNPLPVDRGIIQVAYENYLIQADIVSDQDNFEQFPGRIVTTVGALIKMDTDPEVFNFDNGVVTNIREPLIRVERVASWIFEAFQILNSTDPIEDGPLEYTDIGQNPANIWTALKKDFDSEAIVNQLEQQGFDKSYEPTVVYNLVTILDDPVLFNYFSTKLPLGEVNSTLHLCVDVWLVENDCKFIIADRLRQLSKQISNQNNADDMERAKVRFQFVLCRLLTLTLLFKNYNLVALLLNEYMIDEGILAGELLTFMAPISLHNLAVLSKYMKTFSGAFLPVEFVQQVAEYSSNTYSQISAIVE